MLARHVHRAADRGSTRTDAAVLLGLAALAWYLVAVACRSPGYGWSSHDLYAHFYPNLVYAAGRLREGGRGLLWNPLQACGAPFFANIVSGLLYPPHWLFFVLPAERALDALLAVNLLIGSAGTYALCRQLGAGVAAAVVGALAFEVGNSSLHLTVWTPTVAGSYVWLPVALLCAERIIAIPNLRRGIALGAALAAALLAGYPQTVVIAAQVIGLRVLWALLDGRHGGSRLAIVGVTAFGLALVPLLTAVQLLPAAEVARESVRAAELPPEQAASGLLAWENLWRDANNRRLGATPFSLIPLALSAVALVAPARRGVALFYAVAGVLHLLLSLGPATELFSFYLLLPFGSLFRGPSKFLWVTNVCVAVLSALGVHALATTGGARLRGVAFGVMLAAVLALWASLPGGFRPLEWVTVVALLAACPLVWRRTGPRRAIGVTAGIGILATTIVPAPNLWMGLLPDTRPLQVHAALFETSKVSINSSGSRGWRMPTAHGSPSALCPAA